MILKIISGGQTGVDRMALMAAREMGIKTGGWAPKGWLTELGPDSSLQGFGLHEHASPEYQPRTFANVRDSDATLWLGPFDGRGYICTRRAAEELNKPFMASDIETGWFQNLCIVPKWIKDNNIETLNVAGHRLSKWMCGPEAVHPFIRAIAIAVNHGWNDPA